MRAGKKADEGTKAGTGVKTDKRVRPDTGAKADKEVKTDTGVKAVQAEEKKSPETRFTKEQLKEAKQFAGCEDVLEALLDAKKCYTKQETVQLMEQFRKGDRKVC